MARAEAVAELGATTSGRLEVTLCGMAFLPGRNSPSLDLCKAKVVHLSPRFDGGRAGVGFKKSPGNTLTNLVDGPAGVLSNQWFAISRRLL